MPIKTIFLEITFYREVDTEIVKDILSLQSDGIEVHDYRQHQGYFVIGKSPYSNKELASAIALHLEQQHSLKVLREESAKP